MPTPVFVACCSDFVEDKETNLVILIKMVERLTLSLTVTPAIPDGALPEDHAVETTGLQMHGVASWMRALPSDDEGEFIHQFRMVLPSGVSKDVGQPQSFTFADTVRDTQRFVLRFPAIPLSMISGICHLESVVRRPDSNAAVVQRYPFKLIMKFPQSEETADQPSGPTNSA